MELVSFLLDFLVDHIDDVDSPQELLLYKCSQVLAEEFLSNRVLFLRFLVEDALLFALL